MDYIKGLFYFTLPHVESPMDLTLLLLLLFPVVLNLHPAEAWPLERRNSSNLTSACNAIAEVISDASQVFYPCERPILLFVMAQSDDCQASPQYLSDISHFTVSSTQQSACSVEPGSTEDVSKIVSYLYLMKHISPTHIFLAFISGIKPNPFRGERWRTYTEPGIFLNERRGDRSDALQ